MNSEMDEVRCILTMEHYTAVKMNKLLLHTMTVNSHKPNVEQKKNRHKRVHNVRFHLHKLKIGKLNIWYEESG